MIFSNLLIYHCKEKEDIKELTKTHPSDINSYKQVILDNNLRTTFISRKDMHKSFICISINSGSFQDPSEFQGMAHFVEHLLTKGSEKYPKNSDLEYFLSKYNGTKNATTYNEQTIFYMYFDSKNIEQACDIFSQYFITPLFDKDSIENEIEIVNHEFEGKKNSEMLRAIRIYNITSEDNSPINNFYWGNCKSLKKEGLREKVIEFWKNNFKHMNLIIYNGEEFNEMKKIVDKTFGNIKNLEKPIKVSNINRKYEDIKRNYFHKNPLYIEIEPFSQINCLFLWINLPTEHKMPYNQYNYIKWLLEKSERGSLQDILKEKGLIYDLKVGIENSSYYTNLRIQCSLTIKGRKNIIEVFKEFIMYNFVYYPSYTSKLTQDFNNWEIPDHITLVKDLALSMNNVPFEDLFEHKKIYNFDQKLFEKIVYDIKNYKNWTVIHLKKDKNFDKIEDFHNIKYNSNLLTDKMDKELFKQYIYDLEVKKPKNEGYTKIYSEMMGKNKFLYVYSDKYSNMSKIDILFHAKYDFINFSLLMQNFLKNISIEFAHLIYMEKISFDFSIKDSGFMLTVKSKNIDKAIEIITDKNHGIGKLYEGYDQSKHKDDFKENIRNKLFLNLRERPYYRLKNILKKKLFNIPLSEELTNLLENFKFKPIHIKNMEIMFSGEIEMEKALVYAKDIFNGMNTFENEIDEPENIVNKELKTRTLEKLIENITVFTHASLCAELHTVGVFLKAQKNNKNWLICKIILMYTKKAFYHDLRTTQQLGYFVSNTYHILKEDLFFEFKIESDRDCLFLIEQIKNFIKKIPESFPEENFMLYKEALRNTITEEKTTFNKFIDSFWNINLMGFDITNYHESCLKILDELNFEDIDFDNIFEKIYIVKVEKKKSKNISTGVLENTRFRSIINFSIFVFWQLVAEFFR